MYKVDIVIVNWNSGELLKSCLISLEEHGLESIGKVIVVDNNSNDKSMDLLGNYSFDMEIIFNKTNTGFAFSCNQGAKVGESEYILFLNPDTEIFEKSLSSPLEFMNCKENQLIAITGVKLQDSSGNFSTSCARFPTARVFFGKATGLTYIFPTYFYRSLMSESECKESQYVDEINGAFLIIRRAIFNSLNGFDERFFVYFEEVDLCYRANQKGYKAYFISDIGAYHKGGGCSDNVIPERLFYSWRSRIKYGEKHFKFDDLFLLYVTTFIIEPIARGVFSIFSIKKIIQVFKAYWSLIKWMSGRL